MWEISEEQKAWNSARLLVTYTVSSRKANWLGLGLQETAAWGLGDLRNREPSCHGASQAWSRLAFVPRLPSPDLPSSWTSPAVMLVLSRPFSAPLTGAISEITDILN